MQKLFKKLLLVLCLTTIFLPLDNIFSQEDVREELNVIENERNQRVEEQLLLNLPEISDNPNHIITFKDPSGNGVSLEIDGQGFTEISSPHTLPSLGLGKHILTFKFSDEQKTEQILERSFTIIPRPPVINPPSIVENEIIISGTSISNAKVDLFLTRDIHNQKAQTETDENGKWEYTFSENIDEGIYTIIATTRRNGISSNYSEPIVFNVGDENVTVVEETKEGELYFSFGKIDFSNFQDISKILKTNPDLPITLGIFFVLGGLLTWLVISIVQRISQGKSKKVLRELLKNKTSDDGGSLREKFEKSKPEEKEEVVQELAEEIAEELETKDPKEIREEEEEREEEAKSITKDEFLKNFKDFDPDDDKGEEKEIKKKKNIKISLTSKD